MGKRTKQYKRLMRSFEFLGFRQPYQLLMTSDIIMDTLKVDVIHLFEKTLSTKNLKPMITQCSIRALYNKNVGPDRDPAVAGAIERAKTFERRRCGHLMDEDPLPEHECVMSVVDPKQNGQNKFRYLVATQDVSLREKLRSVIPTPLMYVKRGVLILEPMAASSAKVREREERAKFTDGILRQSKRKREDSEDEGDSSSDEEEGGNPGDASKEPKEKKKKAYGKKQPNPLAVKKAKLQTTEERQPRKPADADVEASAEPQKAKRKRRKKAKTTEGADNEGETQVETRAENQQAEAVVGAED